MDAYAELIRRGMPDLIEVKGVTYCGESKASPLTIKNCPFHEQADGRRRADMPPRRPSAPRPGYPTPLRRRSAATANASPGPSVGRTRSRRSTRTRTASSSRAPSSRSTASGTRGSTMADSRRCTRRASRSAQRTISRRHRSGRCTTRRRRMEGSTRMRLAWRDVRREATPCTTADMIRSSAASAPAARRCGPPMQDETASRSP